MSYPVKAVVSGTVGQQSLATTKAGILRGYSLVGSGAVRMQIRDGNASGTMVWEARGATSAGGAYHFPGEGIRFGKGMHVKIIGTGGTAYLLLD